jgi:hypothetical protein
VIKVEVFSCQLKEGIGQKSGRPYRFFVLNVQMQLDNGQRAGGDLLVDQEIKPGVYSCTLAVENQGGQLAPKFVSFQPLTKAA